MNQGDRQHLDTLVKKYEAMSKHGDISYLERDSFLSLINYYEGKQLFEQALGVAEQALSQHGFSGEFYVRKAQILISSERYQDALDCLEIASSFLPNDSDLIGLRVEALIELRRFPVALSLIQDRLRDLHDAERSTLYFCEALVHEAQRNYSRMFHSLRKAIQADPENDAILEKLWLCVELNGNYEESIRLHQWVIDQQPYSFLAWYNLGHACFYLKQYSKALSSFEYAFLINDRFEFAYRDYAETCIHIQDYQKALEIYDEIISKFEPDADLYMRMGLCYEKMEQFQQARDLYIRSLQLDNLNDEIHFRLGECYMQELMFVPAINCYKKALELNGMKEEHLAAIAEAYFQTEQNELAEIYFRKAVDVAPEDAQYWNQFASFLLDTGQSEAACELLEEASLYCDRDLISSCYIAALLMNGQRREGFHRLGETLHTNPNVINEVLEFAPALIDDPELFLYI